ncbi:MAG: ABC transporter permease [Actinobacteria bacterium]|nr:ABC transporter permease [Actinomycetota bacterium]
MRRWGATRVNYTSAVAWGTVAAVVLLQLVKFGMPFGVWVESLVKGVLASMLAIGLALIYRANRVVNFAQADLGTVPTGFAASFVLFWGWPYFLGLGAGLAMALMLGALVEMVFIRRFRGSPRMVVTVATLGISQLLVLLGILIPRWWGKNLASERLDPPVDWKFTPTWQLKFWQAEPGSYILNANHLIALALGPLSIAFVAWFLNRSRLGIAIRASAERSDRAAMLGIPVARLNTIVWSIAGALAFLALFLRSGITGVPLGYAAGLPALLVALAALVIGRLERLPTIACAAIALSLLESGVNWNSESPYLAYPIMAAAMFIALLAQPASTSRRDNDATSSWRGAEEVRPLPPYLANWGWVPTVKWTLIALAVLGVVSVPLVLEVDNVIKATALVAFVVIGFSLVVLTGWAGQISFGQMALAGIGGAVSATLTSRWNVDMSLSLLVGGLAGGAAAFLVGVPALRLRGLYLAVTTFALALATEYWLLNDRFFHWFPRAEAGFERAPLFGQLRIDTPTRFYAYSVVVLSIVYLALRGIRRSRTGRVIVAIRENERAAQSFSVDIVRAKLTAFVISGVVAGVGGALLVQTNKGFSINSFTTGESFNVFISAVIGGLGSLGGAFLGALYLRGTRWFINDQAWQLLSTGFGVLLVLLVLPGGLGSLWVKLRDTFVRLLTGHRVDEPPPDDRVVAALADEPALDPATPAQMAASIIAESTDAIVAAASAHDTDDDAVAVREGEPA